MADGRTVLLIAVGSALHERMRAAIEDVPEFAAADRTLGVAAVDGDSGNVLREAIAAVHGRARPRRGPTCDGGSTPTRVGSEVLLSALGPGRRRSAPPGPDETTPLGPRDLDAVRLERGQQPLAELASGGPLLGRPDGAEDLERHAVLAERLDALDPRRLEDAPLPDRSPAIVRPTSSTTSMARSMSVP